ncbi:type 1 glutamine amidotransferase [Paremcibacter congregatus]|uniref:type 1 glutamine amidotransferase n=1 Tax=Paremcibacter congregatus TaxID=2043170 RepID=UPI0030ED044E|tara:strand:+ start:521 stop:1363 length:843 start_codon:yes stop_codon:yes gene_type:complete
MLKILIVEGNTRQARELTVAGGAMTQSELYKRNLLFLRPAMQCDIVMAADEDALLPEGAGLESYDGIVWTGSSLNIYKTEPAITRQIDFMKSCFRHKVKIFGSCWGLQVAVVAAGGEVAQNVKGREIGIARDIRPTVPGRQHPLYKNKELPFDAVAIHLDHTVRLPEGATILSGNDISRVQALEIRRGKAVFWGVQYHPEFDLGYMASLFEKYKPLMVEEGFCPDLPAVDRLAADYRAAQEDITAVDIQQRHDMGPDVLEPCCRLQEIRNWLDFVATEAA